MKSIFTKDSGIPPMFSESFRDVGPEWKRLSGIDFEIVGRILICHLIIEHYLTNLIELKTSKEFDWSETKLTFAQKQKLTRKIDALAETKFSRGIEIVNKIRNKFSHNLLAKIDEAYILELRTIINTFRKSQKSEEISTEYEEIAVVEIFTSMVCAFIAGYCSSIVTNNFTKQSSKSKKESSD